MVVKIQLNFSVSDPQHDTISRNLQISRISSLVARCSALNLCVLTRTYIVGSRELCTVNKSRSLVRIKAVVLTNIRPKFITLCFESKSFRFYLTFKRDFRGIDDRLFTSVITGLPSRRHIPIHTWSRRNMMSSEIGMHFLIMQNELSSFIRNVKMNIVMFT